jgi:hypothetical protein
MGHLYGMRTPCGGLTGGLTDVSQGRIRGLLDVAQTLNVFVLANDDEGIVLGENGIPRREEGEFAISAFDRDDEHVVTVA